MIFNLGGIVTQLSSHTVNVTRFAADGFDVNGRATARTVASTFTAAASVQPITGKDLERLPEGYNDTELISVWSKAELRVRDQLEITGRGFFEVGHVDHWNDSGGYWKAIAKKLDQVEEP